jgi:hypothetical protein
MVRLVTIEVNFGRDELPLVLISSAAPLEQIPDERELAPTVSHAKVVGIVPPFYGPVKLWFPISQ